MLRASHDAFTGQLVAYPETPDYPTQRRWSDICATFPCVARRMLHEPMNDVYKKVLEDGTHHQLAQALSLVQLQIRYLGYLFQEKRLLAHQYDRQNAGYWVWQIKVIDALGRSTPAKRHKGEIIPSTREAPTFLPWLN